MKEKIDYYLSNEGKNKRKLNKYLAEKKHYSELSYDELECLYIEVKTNFEHNKRFLTLLSVTIFLAIMAVIFSVVKDVGVKLLSTLNTATFNNNEELIIGALIIVFVIVLFIGVISLIVFGITLYSVKRSEKKLLMIENELAKKCDQK